MNPKAFSIQLGGVPVPLEDEPSRCNDRPIIMPMPTVTVASNMMECQMSSYLGWLWGEE